MKAGTIYGSLRDRPNWVGGNFNKTCFKVVVEDDGGSGLAELQRMGSSSRLDLTTSLPSVSPEAVDFIVLTGKRLIAGAMSDKENIVALIRSKLGEECPLSDQGTILIFHRIETTKRDIDEVSGINEKVVKPNGLYFT